MRATLFTRHGEHAERIGVAQVLLHGERELREVGQRLQVVRVHAGRVEARAVEGRVGVGVRQRPLQPLRAAAQRSRRARRSRSARGRRGGAQGLPCIPPKSWLPPAQAGSGRCVPLTVREWPRNSAMCSPFWLVIADVVDAAAAAPRHLARGRGQPVAAMGRRDEGHRAVLRHGALVVAVAGEGEGRIGQREDVAAMAGAVAVGHLVGDGHRERRRARRDVFERHAEALRGAVLVPTWLRAGLRQRLRVVGRVGHCPVNSGWRFSRNAATPSA